MIILKNINKIYRTKKDEIKALDNIDLEIKEGEFVIIRGSSGSGKTTLLMCIGAMLRPTSGCVIIGETELYKLSPRDRAKFRADNIGFVFQMFHLIPYLNVTDNVLLPAGSGIKRKSRMDEKELIKQLGMEKRQNHKPAQLSTGERQRTAIARALLNQPKIILADEPTGNLDPENAEDVITHLKRFHQTGGTVIVVTHGTISEEYADRIVLLKNGCIEDIK